MTIEFRLERSDLIAFTQERRRYQPQWLARLYYTVILPLFAVALALASHSLWIGMVFTLLFAVAGWLISERSRQLYNRAAFSDDNLFYVIRPWQVTLTSEGVQMKSDAGEVLYRWPYFRKIFRDSRYVQLMLTPLQRLHVPVRAFENEQEIAEFVKEARSYIKDPMDQFAPDEKN